MPRHIEAEQEIAAARKSAALVHALDYGIAGGLDVQGVHLLGMSIKHSAMDCLITLRADIGGVQHVCFVGSDTLVNCFLKCQADVKRDALRWRVDKYARSKV